MDRDIVFARDSGMVAFGGQRIQIRAGEPWRSSDPLVKEYPSYFTDTVRAVRSSTAPDGYERVDQAPEAPVERATAAPGERRTTRRAGR